MQREETSAGAGVLVAAPEWVMPRRPTWAATAWRFVRRKPLGAFGLAMVLVVIAMTVGTPQAEFGLELPDKPLGFKLGAPWLAPHHAEDPFYNEERRIDTFAGPRWSNWLGTDDKGRDIWSRVVWGARRSLFVGLWALTLATFAGTAIGVISAYFRGWLDTLLQRFMDSLQAFPALLILLLVLSLSGPSLTVLAIALSVAGAPSVQRIVRGVVLATREQPYVEAARVLGASDPRIMAFHILPNIMAPIIVVFSIGLGAVILAEAAISFIVPSAVPPTPSWGLMLADGRSVMLQEPGMVLASGGAIALAVLGFNLAGDALRDVLDPRLRLG